MDFRLLGPVQVWHADRLVDAGPARQRAVLAALAVDAGSPVPMDSLIDRVWDDAPPARARHLVYSYVARIRHVIACGDSTATVVRRSGGYQLDIDPSQVDVCRWRALVGEARRPGRSDAEQAELLNRALRLWRGAPLGDLDGSWVTQLRDGWHLRRIEAASWWAEAQVRLGRPELAIGPISVLAADYPLVESLSAILLRALTGAGRGAEALDRYAALRRRLADVLGVDPGPELRAVHRSILRGELVGPGLSRPAERNAPAQLPMDVPHFVGRAADLRRLDRAAADAVAGRSVGLVVLSGTAGAGKTALAVHWAHRIRARFPDGQFHVDMRGFDPARKALTAGDVLDRFLPALGQPPAEAPADLETRSALFRTLLTGRRVLILLDNVRDADRVRPLLPAAPGCLVLVTSRLALTSLVAAEGAQPVPVGVLSGAEANELFRRRLGAAPLAHDPTIDLITERCARLPLAIVIAAARAATRPGAPLVDLAAELDDRPLDTLSTGEIATDVRAGFSASYAMLGPAEARLFRMVGSQADADLSLASAARLAGLSQANTAPLLRELVRANLVTEPVAGRYTVHVLLRAYAAERARRAHQVTHEASGVAVGTVRHPDTGDLVHLPQ